MLRCSGQRRERRKSANLQLCAQLQYFIQQKSGINESKTKNWSSYSWDCSVINLGRIILLAEWALCAERERRALCCLPLWSVHHMLTYLRVSYGGGGGGGWRYFPAAASLWRQWSPEPGVSETLVRALSRPGGSGQGPANRSHAGHWAGQHTPIHHRHTSSNLGAQINICVTLKKLNFWFKLLLFSIK